MNTVIFRVLAPYITSLMLIFSVFVLLRGHNEQKADDVARQHQIDRGGEERTHKERKNEFHR